MHFYGTIGPACASAGTLRRLVDAGMTGLRMNLSHGALAEHADWLAMIHAVGIPDLLIDLQGPELRVGRLASPVTLPEGGTVQLGAGGIPCPVQLVQAARPGQQLLLDDGKLLVEVTAAGPDALVCTVLRGGVLQSRKSIAAPGLSVPMPTLTSEDLANLRIAASCGVTGVMLPFVRGKQDILALRQALAEAGVPRGRGGHCPRRPGQRHAAVGAAPLPETAFRRLPGRRGTLYGGHPDAGQHVHPCRAHPRRGERYLQCCVGWCVQPDAHRRDRRRAVPRAGHGVPGSDGKHRPVRQFGLLHAFSARNDKKDRFCRKELV